MRAGIFRTHPDRSSTTGFKYIYQNRRKDSYCLVIVIQFYLLVIIIVLKRHVAPGGGGEVETQKFKNVEFFQYVENLCVENL